ncbi:MAG: baseplate J/gp47 family protein, partial [bacterium]|nr:baseplate J/gp47 family protein [bacterium]
LLQSPAPKQRKPSPVELPVAQGAVADIESELIADLAAARKDKVEKVKEQLSPSGKHIRDVVTQKNDATVEVDETPEEHVELPISRTPLIPPQAAKAETKAADIITPDIEKLWEQEEQQVPEDEGKPSRKIFSFKGISKKFIFIPAGCAVVALGIILYITVGNAKITLTPHTEPLDLDLTVTASPKTDTVDSEFNKIPGQELTVQKEAQGTYELSVTKEVAQKATGTITVTNKSGASQRLVATTRFESPDGKIFRIPETINVPAGGSIDSAVYADRPGVEYNIAAAAFTIPGLKGTPQFASITGVSSAAMAGGFIGNAKVVTEADFTKALEELTKQAKDQVTQALLEQSSELKFSDEVTIVIANPVVNAKSGEAAEKLEMKISASASVIAYRESDVKKLAQNYLEKNGGLELTEKGLVIEYSGMKLDATAKTLTFHVKMTGTSASKIDTVKVLQDIKGMNEEAMRAYFKNQKEVAEARIKMSFWLRSVPEDPNKVELVVDR